MKTKINMEDPLQNKHLKENPFTVPQNYFEGVKEIVSDKISDSQRSVSLWTVLKPQLGLVSAFAIVFIAAYSIFGLVGDKTEKLNESGYSVISSNETPYIEEGFLKTSFIDFFDSSTDSLSSSDNSISQEELIDYINQNVDLVTLSYLEVKD